MKTFLFAAFFLGLGACAQQAPAPLQGEALVTRGDYLVNSVGGCNDCHTPMTPQGPDMSHALQGATLIVAPTIEIPWAPVAPAIAGGPAGYTNDQFVAFLQTGARPNGSHPRPPMPAFRFNEEDARAVAAYIETLPRETPQP
jgi:mono/diheme cytochrome c family protein